MITTKDRLEIDPKFSTVLVVLWMNNVFVKFICENKHRALIDVIVGISNQINESEDLWYWIMFNFYENCEICVDFVRMFFFLDLEFNIELFYYSC